MNVSNWKWQMRALIASFLLLTSASANAVIITLDAENLAPGTDVSHAIDGVTILSYFQPAQSTYSPVISPVFVSPCSPIYCDQQQVFGSNWGEVNVAYDCERGSGSACRTSFLVMNVFFDEPTDFFSFESSWLSDRPALYAFDSAGNLLLNCYAYSPGDCFQTNTDWPYNGGHMSEMGFTRAEADVARVMVGVASGYGRIHQLSVSVPEPSSIALCGLALATAVVFRRRRSAAVHSKHARSN